MSSPHALEGGCTCGAIRYRLTGEPLATFVCHCTECQRQSGSAFAMSLMIPRDSFALLRGALRSYTRTSDSGRELGIAFCGDCGTRIFHEPRYREGVLNLKPGTLDDTSWLQPTHHFWTRSRQAWVELPEGVACFEMQQV
jgi:hypothetical protein